MMSQAFGISGQKIFKMKKLYLDDLRTPVNNEFEVVRSYEEAVTYIVDIGLPDFISFDHDLGIDEHDKILPSGYDFAKWLVEADLNGKIDITASFTFTVHSQNPVGKENIEKLLGNYLEMKRPGMLDTRKFRQE